MDELMESETGTPEKLGMEHSASPTKPSASSLRHLSVPTMTIQGKDEDEEITSNLFMKPCIGAPLLATSEKRDTDKLMLVSESATSQGQSSASVPAADTRARVPHAPRVQGVYERTVAAKKRKGSGSNLADSVSVCSDSSCELRTQLSKTKLMAESSRRRAPGLPSLDAIEESDLVDDMVQQQPARSFKSRLTHRSNPTDIVDTIKMLSLGQREEIKRLGWGKFLEFNLQALESRDLYCWLMEKIDLNSMELWLPNGKVLPITEHAVNLVLGVPMGRGNIPHHTTAEVTAASSEFREAQGLADRKITIQRLQQEIRKHRVDAMSMKCFFMIVFSKLLFPSTTNDTSVKDIRLTMDLDKFGEINWCRAIIQDIKDAACSWQTRNRKSTSPSINGRAALVIVYYLDNLDHPLNKVDRLITPRCNFFDKRKIEAITIADKVRRSRGHDHYGLLQMMSQVGSCYQAPLPEYRAAAHVPCQPMPSLHVPLMRDLLANDLNLPNARKQKELATLVHALDTEVQAKMMVISHAQQSTVEVQYKHAANIHREGTSAAATDPADPSTSDDISVDANTEAHGASGHDASTARNGVGIEHEQTDNESLPQDCPDERRVTALASIPSIKIEHREVEVEVVKETSTSQGLAHDFSMLREAVAPDQNDPRQKTSTNSASSVPPATTVVATDHLFHIETQNQYSKNLRSELLNICNQNSESLLQRIEAYISQSQVYKEVARLKEELENERSEKTAAVKMVRVLEERFQGQTEGLHSESERSQQIMAAQKKLLQEHAALKSEMSRKDEDLTNLKHNNIMDEKRNIDLEQRNRILEDRIDHIVRSIEEFQKADSYQ